MGLKLSLEINLCPSLLIERGHLCKFVSCFWGFPGCSVVKNPPAMQETQVPSLRQENPLEEGMATHASILAWRIPWTEEPGRLQFMGSRRVGHY